MVVARRQVDGRVVAAGEPLGACLARQERAERVLPTLGQHEDAVRDATAGGDHAVTRRADRARTEIEGASTIA